MVWGLAVSFQECSALMVNIVPEARNSAVVAIYARGEEVKACFSADVLSPNSETNLSGQSMSLKGSGPAKPVPLSLGFVRVEHASWHVGLYKRWLVFRRARPLQSTAYIDYTRADAVDANVLARNLSGPGHCDAINSMRRAN